MDEGGRGGEGKNSSLISSSLLAFLRFLIWEKAGRVCAWSGVDEEEKIVAHHNPFLLFILSLSLSLESLISNVVEGGGGGGEEKL